MYGPHGIAGFEWRIIRRILDRRTVFVTGDGGQQIATRCAAPNAAHAIGLAIDQPAAAGGQIYNVGDDRQFTFRQWIELVAAAADHHFEFVDIPYALASPGYLSARSAVNGGGRYHRLLSTAKIQRELGYADAVDQRTGSRTRFPGRSPTRPNRTFAMNTTWKTRSSTTGGSC